MNYKANLMNLNNRFAITLLFLNLVGASFMTAQPILNLEDAIALALENNHQIRVTRNQAESVENLAHPGQAGLLPSAQADASYNYQNNDIKQTFSSPTVPSVDQNGVINTTRAASLGLNYTLSDGFGNVYRFRQLKKNSEAAELNARVQIETTLLNVIGAYLNLLLAEDNLQVLEQTLTVSNDRLLRARARRSSGTATQLEVLTAEVDLNTDSTAYFNQVLALENAKRDLGLLLGQNDTFSFSTVDELKVQSDLELGAIREDALKNNANLLFGRVNTEIANLGVKIQQQTYLPSLNLNGVYQINKADFGAGFFKSQETKGLNLTAAVSLPLFAGMRRKISVENARISLENAKINQELAKETTVRNVLNTFAGYKNNVSTFEREMKAVKLAEMSLKRSRESYTLGQITYTQFREAQLNLLQTRIRRNSFRIQSKVSEIQLKVLAGSLLHPQD